MKNYSNTRAVRKIRINEKVNYQFIDSLVEIEVLFVET